MLPPHKYSRPPLLWSDFLAAALLIQFLFGWSETFIRSLHILLYLRIPFIHSSCCPPRSLYSLSLLFFALLFRQHPMRITTTISTLVGLPLQSLLRPHLLLPASPSQFQVHLHPRIPRPTLRPTLRLTPQEAQAALVSESFTMVPVIWVPLVAKSDSLWIGPLSRSALRVVSIWVHSFLNYGLSKIATVSRNTNNLLLVSGEVLIEHSAHRSQPLDPSCTVVAQWYKSNWIQRARQVS